MKELNYRIQDDPKIWPGPATSRTNCFCGYSQSPGVRKTGDTIVSDWLFVTVIKHWPTLNGGGFLPTYLFR